MLSIEKCHRKIRNDTNSIEESDLHRVALYIHHYTNIIFQSEDVEITGREEHEEITYNMYRSFLNMIIEFDDGESRTDLESRFHETLDDFENDVDSTLQNIYIISGYANSSQETRNTKITEFVNRIAGKHGSN